MKWLRQAEQRLPPAERALAILETLAGRYNELQRDLKAGEQITIQVGGVEIEELGVRGSLLWLYSRDRARAEADRISD
jgi:hypothetical protein